MDHLQSLRETEEKLKQSEKRFEALLEHAHEGIVILSASGHATYVSPSLKKILGYDPHELLQMDLAAFTHPDDLESLLKIRRAALDNPDLPIAANMSRHLHKDGSWRWMESTVTNKLNDPAVKGIVNNFRDVNSRQAALDKIDENEYRFRTLLEQSADGIILFSEFGKPFYVSPAIEKILGYTEQQAVEAGLLENVHPDDQHLLLKRVQFILSNPGKPAEALLTRILHHDGQWRYIESTLTNMLSDPSIKGIVGNFRDATSRIMAQRELLYMNRLYNFTSQINQAIIHATNEQDLFEKVCHIALEYGKFRLAWIGIAKPENRKIRIAANAGMSDVDLHFFNDYTYQTGGPMDVVLAGENYYAVPDISKRSFGPFMDYAKQRGFESAIFLAIKRNGKAIGTFNLYAAEKNFFNLAEIRLLEAAANEISFAIDVFDKDKKRTNAEKALQYKELRLVQAQSAANFGSWEIDLESQKIIWSEQMFRIYGLPVSNASLTYETWLALIHPDDRATALSMTKNAIPKKENNAFYHRIIRKDGKIRHLHSHCQFEFDESGKAITLTGVAQDITEIKTAKEKILKIAEEKNTILESIGDAFFALDNQWNVTYWNKEAENLLARPKEQIIGKNLWESFPDAVDSDFYKNYHKAVSQNEIIHFQEYYVGQKRWYEASAYPSPKGLSVYFKDITARINAENERTKMLTDIMLRNKDLEQFSFIISHNLRAPVANIIGLVEELNQEIHSLEVKNILKRELSLSTKKLDDVILDLNSILRLKKEIVENKEIVNLDKIIENIKHSIQNIINDEKVHIETDFEAVSDIHTLKSYLHSIFYNLISNSIKYRRPDVEPRIEIKSSKTTDGILIEFMDNGIGMDVIKKKSEVFGLYKRFHQHVEGKGIGLFMVKTQVEILGGTINVKSAVNKGTYFKIEFPQNNL